MHVGDLSFVVHPSGLRSPAAPYARSTSEAAGVRDVYFPICLHDFGNDECKVNTAVLIYNVLFSSICVCFFSSVSLSSSEWCAILSREATKPVNQVIK